jgi:hypothetical protein
MIAPTRKAVKFAIGKAVAAAAMACRPSFAHLVKSAVMVPESANVAITRVMPAPRLNAPASDVAPA